MNVLIIYFVCLGGMSWINVEAVLNICEDFAGIMYAWAVPVLAVLLNIATVMFTGTLASEVSEMFIVALVTAYIIQVAALVIIRKHKNHK